MLINYNVYTAKFILPHASYSLLRSYLCIIIDFSLFPHSSKILTHKSRKYLSTKNDSMKNITKEPINSYYAHFFPRRVNVEKTPPLFVSTARGEV